MSNTDFYQHLSPTDLDVYAVKTGLQSAENNEKPLDLKLIEEELRQGEKILEVGCGAGRLAKHLIREYDYTGIDVNGRFLTYCKSRLVEDGVPKDQVEARIKRADFRSYQSDASLDAVIFPWTVIWEFNEDNQVLVLEKAYSLLSSSGRCLIEGPSKGEVYNTPEGYNPAKFYFEDWIEAFLVLGFGKAKKKEYVTNSGRRRDLITLRC